MEDGTLTGESRDNITFVSINLVRAIAIAAVIIENYVTALPWHTVHSFSDTLASHVTEISGTFVQVFFVLSGYGLTLSYYKNPPDSWLAWARKRIDRIIVPYWIAVIATFVLAKLSTPWMLGGPSGDYSCTTLFAYLTFTRNFYSPGWALNWTLWFMPAIVGLYAVFPLLILILRRYGLAALVVAALLITNGSIALCVALGYTLQHQNTLPFFFVDEFTLGMAVGFIMYHRPEIIGELMTPKYFILGLAFYALSAAIIKFHLLGDGSSAYNDLFTAIGLYLIMLSVCRWIQGAFPKGLLDFFDNISKNSYIMYLLHGPIIYYVLKPYLGVLFRAEVEALPMIMSACAYVVALYAMSRCIALMMEGRAQHEVLHRA